MVHMELLTHMVHMELLRGGAPTSVGSEHRCDGRLFYTQLCALPRYTCSLPGVGKPEVCGAACGWDRTATAGGCVCELQMHAARVHVRCSALRGPTSVSARH